MFPIPEKLAQLCKLLDAPGSAGEIAVDMDVVNLARRHRVEPLLYAQLSCAESRVPVAEQAMATLEQDYRANILRIAKYVSHFREITQALAAEGIEARPLKGLPLAEQAYQRIADRHCGDLDLLIESNRSRAKADAIVQSLGMVPMRPKMTASALSVFRAANKDDNYLTSDDTRIELHYSAHGFGRHVFPRFTSFDSPAWETCSIDSMGTYRLHGIELVVYLLSHGTRSAWHRLKWLLDLRRLTRHYDAAQWTAVMNVAKKARCDRQTAIGLHVLAGFFGASSVDPLPKEPRFHDYAYLQCRKALERTPLPGPMRPLAQETESKLYSVLLMQGWPATCAAILKVLIRSHDIARLRLPVIGIFLLAPFIRIASFGHRRVLRPMLHAILRHPDRPLPHKSH